ncbi:endonuclease/exonuclease/phosphatase family protein [Natrinema salaciae]|uniref:Endonuclease/Exonuclease/phosphatase family protein n=1 Tax=Natrinema salaciae TaxID=1186196 RepID=A0A1H9CY62_9EURY|nr:endonuclease/exonuclease/phosphatase family protein [Natrinema salaciae]SEQ06125.1 Endonuclease/Exonuclease/phosphatase family protein [Natrinema salaciae]
MVRDATRRQFVTATGAAIASTGITGTASATGGRAPTAVRYAAFNVIELETGQVQEPGDEQAEAAARIIQEVRPDVLVVNELTNNIQEGERTDRTNIDAFVENYLSVPQRDDLEGIDYPHTLQPDSNTGVLPDDPYDFDKDGERGQRPGDAFGFGEYPGHYAFAIASRYPIRKEGIRSFQEFRWDEMPDNLIVTEESAGDDAERYLTAEEREVFRLSSKTHIDVPFDVDGDLVHGLFAHPTPPGFDGPENFNGRWNHDEVRFLADYVAGADYIYDDSGVSGGLEDDASYVLLGDMNAGPRTDRPLDPATTFLFANDDFDTCRLPTSPGGAQRGNPYATRFGGDFDGVVEQIDYVLPSPDLSIRRSSVVWPADAANERGLGDDVSRASDHRLVWADIVA